MILSHVALAGEPISFQRFVLDAKAFPDRLSRPSVLGGMAINKQKQPVVLPGRLELGARSRPRVQVWLPAGAISVAISVASPAQAQRQDFRDKNGNPRFYVEQEGNRSVLRDNAGNPHGYWQKEGSWLVHRDNAGNLLDRQEIK
jgi:hypothetical protein